ncbi:MAG: UPF0262 family protein [Pseudomonadota bacterium]
MRDPRGNELPPGRLIEVTLDPGSISRNGDPRVERERQMAIYDLLDCNSFELVDFDIGPYRLIIGARDARFIFNIQNEMRTPLIAHMLPFALLKRIISDYFIVCDSYCEAIKSAPPSRIEALDMGRRNLHDEGSRTLVGQLGDNIKVDHDTGRRLFTLICSLYWKG